MIDFSERVRRLSVRADDKPGGELVRGSQFQFAYAADAAQPISLIMPLADREFTDGALFAVMDMNLPEGFLLAQLRERSPKVPPSEMQLLALMGANGIGQLAYHPPGAPPRTVPAGIDRAHLIRKGAGRRNAIFLELVDAYLATGSGISGVQPKIVAPERGTFPIPNLIVKAGGASYPGIAANEYLCLQVAQRARLDVPRHELSDDGDLLVIDRFDLLPDGGRLGFEDIAALLDLRVGGALSSRKYRGSYEDIAGVLGDFCSEPRVELGKFFDFVVLTVMLRNGDGHLKNYGVTYDGTRVRLSPVYDVVTTTIYPYERGGGVQVVDRTMALKLRVGDRLRLYPDREALVTFGREVCGVASPAASIERIADAMDGVLSAADRDDRLPKSMLKQLSAEWRDSISWQHLPLSRSKR